MSVTATEAPARRRRVFDANKIALRTSAGVDGHAHCAVIDNNGNGITSAAKDGHWHRVRDLDVVPMRGHTHELTESRCEERHNASANHVRGRDAR